VFGLTVSYNALVEFPITGSWLGNQDADMRKDIIDQKFGRLTVIRYLGNKKWLCRCDCGGEARVLTSNITSGNSQSCGCQRRETHFKHGMSDTKIYRIWQQMIRRCEVPHDPAYANYGGRGISVCPEWHEFSRFIADVGIRPEGLQLDRIDNNGNYEPDNWRWVTAKINRNNQRNNRIIEFGGYSRTIAEWADALGVNYRTLNNRLNRGWPVERALTEPVA
jgi:hypothetical protein